jgi:hypothetical protein
LVISIFTYGYQLLLNCLAIFDPLCPLVPVWGTIACRPPKQWRRNAVITQNADGLGALPRPSRWTVEYRITAIALPRVPWHFHSCSQAAIARWRYPVDRTSRVTATSLHWKNAHPHIGSKDASYVTECDSVPSGNALSAGATLGSGARCPKPQSPHVLYCRKSLSASFGSSSFPVREQCTPTFTRRQQLLYPGTKPKFNPAQFPGRFSVHFV